MQGGVIDLSSLIAEVQSQFLPGDEVSQPTPRQYTALNYKGVCYGIISAIRDRAAMDTTFDMGTVAAPGLPQWRPESHWYDMLLYVHHITTCFMSTTLATNHRYCLWKAVSTVMLVICLLPP